MDEALWYKDAVIYELHVRAFSDSNGDGIGDFKGLAGKLDYLQDLGVTAVWLLPFYPSPLKDDGYDISDYMGVHPSYGNLADFKYFLREAHKRGMRVITELVMNHTSDAHPWFRKARRAPDGSPERDFYVWNPAPDKYRDARIIFKDYEHSNWTWDPVAKSYYWHRFYAHQPDLNYDNPKVKKAMRGILDFWLGMGVDGLRLDAVPYLYEREGTNCENLPETHGLLKEFRKYVDKKYPNRMFLAEANQWPEDAVHYFGQGSECHMAFHFPLMPRLFMCIHMEDRFPVIDILNQTPSIPDPCQWAIFLRNHDELTLEMVTDEERDYMYRVYAHDPKARINLGIRRRLAPLLGNHRRKIELMNGLLFSLPGTPVLYYGDEMGMGDNIYLGDRNGVRTPMQWSADKNAGFSKSNPQQLYLPVNIDPEYHYETVNAEAQQNNPHSLLWWMKRLIALRKRFKAFSRGTIEFLAPENRKVLVYIRKYEEETILVAANLSRFVQYVEMDLSKYKGMVPVEMFGRNEFPSIGELPYFITLSPHSFFWFTLEPVKKDMDVLPSASLEALPKIQVQNRWDEILKGDASSAFLKLLPGYLKTRRWFGGKARKMKNVSIQEAVPVPYGKDRISYFVVIKVDYAEGESEQYWLPLACASEDRLKAIREKSPQALIASLNFKSKSAASESALLDALGDPELLKTMIKSLVRTRSWTGKFGAISTLATALGKTFFKKDAGESEPALMKGEQSNTSVFFGDRYILKLFRKFETGVSPELEMGRYLSETRAFKNVAPVLGALEYSRTHHSLSTIGVVHQFVPNQGDAWKYTLDVLKTYFERVLTSSAEVPAFQGGQDHPLMLAGRDVEPLAVEMISPYLEQARTLGQRTGELHQALTGESDLETWIPEPFTPFYQRSVYQSMRNLVHGVLQTLEKSFGKLPEKTRMDAKMVLSAQPEMMRRLDGMRTRQIKAFRTRHHGDLHLGQVLYDGKDFIFLDFEGEPARSLSERKTKHSPLRDVAGIIRSFHYAAFTSLFGNFLHKVARPEDVVKLEPWAHFWYVWVSSAYLRAYREAVASAGFLPSSEQDQRILLDLYLLGKALYELHYELNNRPDWVVVPLKGLLQILKPESGV